MPLDWNFAAGELAELSPAVPMDVDVELTNVFRANGMWTTPVISQPGFERWQEGIYQGHLVPELSYADIVDNAPASAALSFGHAA